MNDFILFLVLVDAVLCIILFVKIWGMTSDVRRLEHRFCDTESPMKKFSEHYLCGEYEEAYTLLNHCLANDISKRFYKLSRNDIDYRKRYEEEISDLISKYYSELYKKIGKDIPENLKNVTFDSYNELV